MFIKNIEQVTASDDRSNLWWLVGRPSFKLEVKSAFEAAYERSNDLSKFSNLRGLDRYSACMENVCQAFEEIGAHPRINNKLNVVRIPGPSPFGVDISVRTGAPCSEGRGFVVNEIGRATYQLSLLTESSFVEDTHWSVGALFIHGRNPEKSNEIKVYFVDKWKTAKGSRLIYAIDCIEVCSFETHGESINFEAEGESPSL